MPRKEKSHTIAWILPLLLQLLFLVSSCGSGDKFIGTYKADAGDSPKQAETIVELKPNGSGAWKVGDDEVAFTWYVKGGQLRVNDKGGGVIVGTIEKDTIHITLPGTKVMSFKKIE